MPKVRYVRTRFYVVADDADYRAFARDLGLDRRIFKLMPPLDDAKALAALEVDPFEMPIVLLGSWRNRPDAQLVAEQVLDRVPVGVEVTKNHIYKGTSKGKLEDLGPEDEYLRAIAREFGLEGVAEA